MVTMPTRALALVLVILATTVALPSAGCADEPLKAGDGQGTASRAEGSCRPEILRTRTAVREPDRRLAGGTYHWDAEFTEATAGNRQA